MSGFTILQRFLLETSGFALDDEKGYLIEDRLQPILRAANLKGLDDLANVLIADPRCELARSVAEALTINETSFFRDRSLFNVFSERLLPDLMNARRESRRLRIWCAGCSTGQEPYSLAMAIDDKVRLFSGWNIEILATDLSRAVIDTARRGIYSQFEVQRGLPVAMLLRYFRREGEQWQISDHLRARVTFRTHNLLEDTRGLGRFDLIFCRNVLIYFNVGLKRRVLTSLAGALADDGYLALGAAERVAGLSTRLLQDKSNFIFMKEQAARLEAADA